MVSNARTFQLKGTGAQYPSKVQKMLSIEIEWPPGLTRVNLANGALTKPDPGVQIIRQTAALALEQEWTDQKR